MKNHVFEVFNATTQVVVPISKPLEEEQNTTDTVHFEYTTGIPDIDKIVNGMGNLFWEQIISMIKVNRDYYQCLVKIMDSRNFQTLEDVRVYVALELKKVHELETAETKLTTSFYDNLDTLSNIMGSNNFNYVKPQAVFVSYRNKMFALRHELEEIKRSMKSSENQIKLLQKEKKDLLNILDSYKTENVHKVPLEKRLRSEQEKHVELQAAVNTIFKNKIPQCSTSSYKDRSNYSFCKNIYDLD